MIIMSSSGTDILYKNIKDERYTKQSDFLGKIFLIQDTFFRKLIGNFIPTLKILGNTPVLRQLTVATNQSESILLTSRLKKVKQLQPGMLLKYLLVMVLVQFQGLPGLILELNYDSKVILCSKVILNPKKPITILSPTRRESLFHNLQYDQIVEKKMKGNEFPDKTGKEIASQLRLSP